MSHRLDNYRWDDAIRILSNELDELKAKYSKQEAEAAKLELKLSITKSELKAFLREAFEAGFNCNECTHSNSYLSLIEDWGYWIEQNGIVSDKMSQELRGIL
jgi:hypothetical protein